MLVWLRIKKKCMYYALKLQSVFWSPRSLPHLSPYVFAHKTFNSCDIIICLLPAEINLSLDFLIFLLISYDISVGILKLCCPLQPKVLLQSFLWDKSWIGSKVCPESCIVIFCFFKAWFTQVSCPFLAETWSFAMNSNLAMLSLKTWMKITLSMSKNPKSKLDSKWIISATYCYNHGVGIDAHMENVRQMFWNFDHFKQKPMTVTHLVTVVRYLWCWF